MAQWPACAHTGRMTLGKVERARCENHLLIAGDCYSDDDDDCALRCQVLDVVNMRDDYQRFTVLDVAQILRMDAREEVLADVYEACRDLVRAGTARQSYEDSVFYIMRLLDTPPALDRQTVEAWLDD